MPALGLELEPIHPDSDDPLFLAGSWVRTTRAHWVAFADRLVELGLCLPAKANGLKAWPGRRTVLAPGGVFRLHMGLNHVKVSVAGSRREAKAYGGLSFAPWRASGENRSRP